MAGVTAAEPRTVSLVFAVRHELRSMRTYDCQQDPLLPNVSKEMCLGSISKTHLAFGFKCIKDGICWDHSGLPMKPSGPSKAAIQNHLDHGMLAVILDEKVLDLDPDGLEAIMVAENLDNDLNLPEHEMALLKHVRTAIKEASVLKEIDAGIKKESLWPAVKKKVSETLGGKFQDCFCSCECTYVRTHVRTYVRTYFTYVRTYIHI